ncbi:MAG: DegV family protein [Oscillospiraceae bacterium]|nr:DegV family protein [Oscillospiraceae bacterium]
MNDYVIVTDSSCDLPADLADELGLVVLPLSVTVDGKTFKNYLDGREIDFKEFYAKLRGGANAVTAAVNMETFRELFETELKKGKDIIYLGFSSGLSGTYQAGKLAADELREEYPERKIFTLDTLCASMGQGLCVWHVAKFAQQGKSFEEVCVFAQKIAPRCIHWFTVNDLFFLKRGGRVSAATAMLGTVLNIKPVLHVDDEGHLINMAKARGRKASLNAVFEKLRDTGDDIHNQTIFISHGDCIEDAKYVEGLFRNYGVKDVIISYVGPVIGAHSGPGTLAVFCLGDVR